MHLIWLSLLINFRIKTSEVAQTIRFTQTGLSTYWVTLKKCRLQGCILHNSGDIRSGIQGMGRVRIGQGSFLLVWIFFCSLGLNFESSEIIYINTHEQIREMMTNKQSYANIKWYGHWSGPVNARYIRASNGYLHFDMGQGKFRRDILQSGLKIKIWRSGPGLGC